MRYNHFDMLPDRAFLKVGGRITLEGGGGGGGQQQSTQTSYQTNIPEYLRGPAERMTARGETLSEQAYIPYTGERTAGFNPAQTQAFQDIAGLQSPEQFGQAGESITGAQQFGTAGALGAMGYQPGQFGSQQAQMYMSPYQQAVTDIAKREAVTDAQRLNTELGAKAAKAGAFGGSRFGIEQALLGSKLAQNLSDIQTKGLQSSYENAQQQFERDRAARLAGAKFGLEGAQFGADVGLKSAAQLGQLGTAEQEADLKRISAQQAAGAQQQALEQQKLDQAYQQFTEQRDWEKNQLGFLSGLIRGTPFSTNQLQTTSAPGASTASQLASVGLGAYGLSTLLGKKDGGAIKMAGGGSVEGYAYGGGISGLSDKELQDAASGKNDVVPADVAAQELKRRAKLRVAVQGKRAEQELSAAIDTDAAGAYDGIAGLEADNMGGFADGGIVGYAAGGLPAGYDPAVYEMFEDPTSGEVYPRKKLARAAAYGAELRAKAEGKPSPVPVETVAPVAAAAPAVAPAANPNAGAARPPASTGAAASAAAAAPKGPAPTAESEYIKMIKERMGGTDTSNAAMMEELAKGQKDVENIRSDIKGIAALRAAAAIAQGGPGGTIAQLGRGLGAFGEEAGRGENLMQSARQGLMGQRLQMAQLERAANAGDVTALATLEQLRQQGPLWAAQAEYYKDKGAAAGISGGVTPKLQATIMAQVDKAGKDYAAANPGISPQALQVWKTQEFNRRMSMLGGGSVGGGDGFITSSKGLTVRE